MALEKIFIPEIMKKQLLIIYFVSLLFLFCLCQPSFSQHELKIANIGDFTTRNGNVIKDCKVGYRTLGRLNADKSNVILWPTWFQGKSESIISGGFTGSLLDSSGLYIVIVDALTNGVSSSPSNTPGFPDVTIRDMVNSQHQLLVNVLKINHLLAVMGISMGGMQTFEWVVAYPGFADKAIPIVGTPKQSSYDLLVWQTMADLITEAGTDKVKLDFAYRRAYNILLMNLNTPEYFVKTRNEEGLNAFLGGEYTKLMKPEDYLGGLKAMISHDIYKSAGISFDEIRNKIKTDMLIIVSAQDHLVNPASAIKLCDKLNAQLVTLYNDCGHTAFSCETEKVKNAVIPFLKRKIQK
jgi:homoserine O-acetyltransferase/O-succinyltransferase